MSMSRVQSLHRDCRILITHCDSLLQHGPDAYESLVFNSDSIQDCAVSDGDIAANATSEALVAWSGSHRSDQNSVLEVCVVPNFDSSFVSCRKSSSPHERLSCSTSRQAQVHRQRAWTGEFCEAFISEHVNGKEAALRCISCICNVEASERLTSQHGPIPDIGLQPNFDLPHKGCTRGYESSAAH